MSGDSQSLVNKRKGIRHRSDPSLSGQICLSLAPAPFSCDIAAIIFNESYRGCCLITMVHEKLVTGLRCQVKVGKGDPILGELKWVEQLDAEVIKIGFYFPD